jgi:hypothetical protein
VVLFNATTKEACSAACGARGSCTVWSLSSEQTCCLHRSWHDGEVYVHGAVLRVWDYTSDPPQWENHGLCVQSGVSPALKPTNVFSYCDGSCPALGKSIKKPIKNAAVKCQVSEFDACQLS